MEAGEGLAAVAVDEEALAAVGAAVATGAGAADGEWAAADLASTRALLRARRPPSMTKLGCAAQGLGCASGVGVWKFSVQGWVCAFVWRGTRSTKSHAGGRRCMRLAVSPG